MIILILFAFIAGIVTILSPCILPILPVVLSGTVASGKRKPIGIVLGFIASFTFFTLLTSTLVKAIGFDPDALRVLAIVIIFILGISLLIPQLQQLSERLFTQLANFAPHTANKDGFISGMLIGLSIGLVWTPCVGPILAAVISLSFTTQLTYEALFITLSYAAGTAIPMFAIIYFGKSVFTKIPLLARSLLSIQKIFGILMIFTALAIATETDRKIQTYLLGQFPQWGAGLTKIEENTAVQQALQKLQKPSERAQSPELVAGGMWFNSEPLTIGQLKGKVVLVDFWTYTCINCIRTLPYIKKWDEMYRDKGLVIIGVHAPEFEFEKDPDNVQRAITQNGLKYPIMQDNDFKTWRNFNNHYWPAKYLIDINGNIRYHHFGEGDYNETEKQIQNLLREKDSTLELGKVTNADYTVETSTPETYMGYARMRGFESNKSVVKDAQAKYSSQNKEPGFNKFDWTGDVRINAEYALPQKGAQLRFNYEAKQVFLVMRPKDTQSKVRILLDNKEIMPEYAGEDVRNGEITIDSDRLYRLVKSSKAENHILTIEFLDSNTELFAFTFG
jgi:cytochrome c biogenesis protein CcdA/thiol-disulfide isomerase/thioredoxin